MPLRLVALLLAAAVRPASAALSLDPMHEAVAALEAGRDASTPEAASAHWQAAAERMQGGPTIVRTAYSIGSISGGGQSFSSGGGGDIATVDVTPEGEDGKDGVPSPKSDGPPIKFEPYKGSWGSMFLALFLTVPTLALSPVFATHVFTTAGLAGVTRRSIDAGMSAKVRGEFTEGCVHLVKRYSGLKEKAS